MNGAQLARRGKFGEMRIEHVGAGGLHDDAAVLEAKTDYLVVRQKLPRKLACPIGTDEHRMRMFVDQIADLMDVSLRQNLDIVDKFILDCEQRVKEEPQDELTREYLSGAYQQKAELISVMMDRGGNEN